MYPSYNYPVFTPQSALKLACPTHSIHNAKNDDAITVVMSNVSTPKISKATHSLLDSGATDHFLAINLHVKNKRPAAHKINFEIPDGNNMEATEECNLD